MQSCVNGRCKRLQCAYMNYSGLRSALFFSLVIATSLWAQMPDPLSPTHGVKSAQEIDREWQTSVAKYDSARAAKLRQVDRQATHGPYRPDWETFGSYEIPQWYK